MLNQYRKSAEGQYPFKFSHQVLKWLKYCGLAEAQPATPFEIVWVGVLCGQEIGILHLMRINLIIVR